MSEISILLIVIRCFTFVHLRASAAHEVERNRARQVLARENIHRDVLSVFYQSQESRKVPPVNIVKDPKFVDDEELPPRKEKIPELSGEIPTLLGIAGMKQVHHDYFHIFALRGLHAFSGPAKEEFISDCLRDVVHWLGHNTQTTIAQRRDFCEMFWKEENIGADFSEEIKHVKTQGPCIDDEQKMDFADSIKRDGRRPCNEAPVSGKTFAAGGHETAPGETTHARGYGHDADGGAIIERKIEELNRAVPQGGSAAHSQGSRDDAVSSASDSDTTSHLAHGESKMSYPEEGRKAKFVPITGWRGDTDSKSPFRIAGWRSCAQHLLQPIAVFGLLVLNLHF